MNFSPYFYHELTQIMWQNLWICLWITLCMVLKKKVYSIVSNNKKIFKIKQLKAIHWSIFHPANIAVMWI
ncbi:hypothetical protein A9B99_19810 [Mangrovibacter phragmitis]|uniref:Uncharacterized protein n=1 Tax=Mangrovibacter phragmitis TaxID=1691903 RepID=A0A1B7L6I3_9ENTR|nr:hypothetical protein A9B99_19810 [Mangrovibacter phragmitis]